MKRLSKQRDIRLFISQPMRGLTDEEIGIERERLYALAERLTGHKLTLIDSWVEDIPNIAQYNIPVYYLGKSIMKLSEADIVIFGEGWSQARGCNMEYKIAQAYGITTIDEEELG